MSYALVPFLVAAMLVSTEARAEPVVSRDAVLHLELAAGISGVGYAATARVVNSELARFGVGVGISVSAGFAKEILDYADYGVVSGEDLAWDVVGACTGALVAWLIDRLIGSDVAQTSSSTLEITSWIEDSREWHGTRR